MLPLIFFCIIHSVSSNLLEPADYDKSSILYNGRVYEGSHTSQDLSAWNRYCNLRNDGFLPTQFNSIGAINGGNKTILISVAEKNESIIVGGIFIPETKYIAEFLPISPFNEKYIRSTFNDKVNLDTMHIMQFFEYLIVFPKAISVTSLMNETEFLNSTYTFEVKNDFVLTEAEIKSDYLKNLVLFFKALNTDGQIISMATANRMNDDGLIVDLIIRLTSAPGNISEIDIILDGLGETENAKVFCLSAIFSKNSVEVGEVIKDCDLKVKNITVAVWYKTDLKNMYYHGFLFNKHFAIPIISKILPKLDIKLISKSLTRIYSQYEEQKTPGVESVSLIPVAYFLGCPTAPCGISSFNCVFSLDKEISVIVSGRTIHMWDSEKIETTEEPWNQVNFPDACFSLNDYANVTVIIKGDYVSVLSSENSRSFYLKDIVNFTQPIDAAFYLNKSAYIFSGEKIFKFIFGVKNLKYTLSDPQWKYLYNINSELPKDVDAVALRPGTKQLYIFKREFYYAISLDDKDFWDLNEIEIKKGFIIKDLTTCSDKYYFMGENSLNEHLLRIEKYPPKKVKPIMKQKDKASIYTFKNISLMILAIIAGFLFVYLIANLVEKKFIKKAPPELSHLSTLSGISKI